MPRPREHAYDQGPEATRRRRGYRPPSTTESAGSPMLTRERSENAVSRSTLSLVAVMAITSACANSTQMVASWRDPAQAPAPLGRTLAVFMSADPGMRRMVEDKLAASLPGGTASYHLIPD